jgi:hypothetical protein
MYGGSDTSGVFGALELPFLLIAVVFAFRVADKLKGGSFGVGMQFLAWGFLVMAVGHMAMQIDRYTHINLFSTLLGPVLGDIAWIIALVITWALSAYGFYRIYRAASGR